MFVASVFLKILWWSTMPDFEELQKRARQDIQVALSVWTEVLRSPERGAKFAYSKGSGRSKESQPFVD